MKLKLVKLTEKYKKQFFEMMDEWMSFDDYNRSPSTIRRNDYHDFDNYVANLERPKDEGEYSQDSVYFCLDEERDIFVGAVNIRHHLTSGLCHNGGHIGDGIRPSERGKGYGTEMLKKALEICKELGINKVLITCDKTNPASRKAILKNGGVFDFEVGDDGEIEERYWITLKEEQIETERLIVRREMPSDYRDVFTWASDERVYKYLLSNPVKNPEDIIPWLEKADPNSNEKYYMILKSKADGHAVGTVGVFKRDDGVWEVAYNILFDDWGKGYATEAVGALIKYISNKHGVKIFMAECAAENKGSEAVMKKLGFVQVGESSYSKNDGSATFDSLVYQLNL